MFIYFWDRERQSMNGGGAEREGDTELEAGSRLWAISPEPDAGLTDHEIMTWAEVGPLTNWATQAPQLSLTFNFTVLWLLWSQSLNVRIMFSVDWAPGFSSGHDLMVREFKPHIGLCADSSEPRASFRFCVSVSLSVPPPLMLCHSLKND